VNLNQTVHQLLGVPYHLVLACKYSGPSETRVVHSVWKAQECLSANTECIFQLDTAQVIVEWDYRANRLQLVYGPDTNIYNLNQHFYSWFLADLVLPPFIHDPFAPHTAPSLG